MGFLKSARLFFLGVLACTAIIFLFGSWGSATPPEEWAHMSDSEKWQAYAKAYHVAPGLLVTVNVGAAFGLLGAYVAEMMRQRRQP